MKTLDLSRNADRGHPWRTSFPNDAARRDQGPPSRDSRAKDVVMPR